MAQGKANDWGLRNYGGKAMEHVYGEDLKQKSVAELRETRTLCRDARKMALLQADKAAQEQLRVEQEIRSRGEPVTGVFDE